MANRHPIRDPDHGSDAACLTLAFEVSDDAMTVLDGEGRVAVANGMARAAFGLGDDRQVEGADWVGCWSAASRDPARLAFGTAATGRTARFRGRLAGPGRTGTWWDTRLDRTADGRVLAVSRDVTAQFDTERELERWHRLQRALLDATSEIVWHVDTRTGVTVRRGYQDFTGAPDNPTDMDSWLDLVHVDDRDQAKAAADRADALDEPLTIEYRLLHKSGAWRWVVDSSTPVKNAAGAVTDWIGVITDVQERKSTEQALRKSVEHLRLAAEATGFGTWHVDMRTDERDWSPELFDILRLPRATRPDRKLFLQSVHPDDVGRIDRLLNGDREPARATASCVFRLRFAAGDVRWVEAHERTFFDATGRPIRRAGTLQDVTDRRAAEHEVWLAAHTDALTGVANRALFNQRLDESVSDGCGSVGSVALFLVDLDHFKDVNDTLGHDAGDALLRAAAERLRARVPASALVARLGGDEFGALIPIEPGGPTLEVLAADLIKAVGAPLLHTGRKFECTASIGWSVHPDDSGQGFDLLKKADLALYAAKSAGRNRAAAFAPAMQAQFEHRLNVLRNARDALSREAIVPFYQPKKCLRTGRIVGFEALLRWVDDTGLRGPGELLEAFDDPYLSVRLGRHMLNAVTTDMERWNAAGVPFGHVAINVAAPEFQGGQLGAQIAAFLNARRLPAHQLEIEVTERVLLDDGTGAIEATLQDLHEAGVRIALDDFGTGFASLTHLTKFPVSWVKVDRSFTSEIDGDDAAAAIVRAVVGLAHAINIKVVAEGVETTSQLSFLRDVGCDLAQGFHIAKPMIGSRVPHFLRTMSGQTAARPAVLQDRGDKRIA